MKKDRRISYLDAARGVGIMLVVLGHIWENEDPAAVLIYSFHVPLFFILSGILISYTGCETRSWKQILPGKIRGLLLPYLFYEAVFVVIFGLRNGFDFGSNRVYDGLMMQPLNVPLWFLAEMFAAELFLIWLLKTVKNRKMAALAVLVLYMIPFGAGSMAGQAGINVLLRWCSSLGFLAVGYFAADFVIKKDVPVWLLIVGWAADIALALYNGKTGIYKLTFSNPVLFTVCGICGSLLVIFSLKKIRLEALEFLGTNTLAILGLHIIVLRILQEIVGLNTESYVGGIAAMTLLCAVLAPANVIMGYFLPAVAGKKRRNA